MELISVEKCLFELVQKEWDDMEVIGITHSQQTQKDVSLSTNVRELGCLRACIIFSIFHFLLFRYSQKCLSRIHCLCARLASLNSAHSNQIPLVVEV